MIIGFVVWGLLRGFSRSRVTRGEGAARASTAEDMVACSRCGVHMPRSDANVESGSFYCRDNPRCLAPR